ncbi:hypothetical protein JCM10049v2_002570 [Rhodotorula toruloides]
MNKLKQVFTHDSADRSPSGHFSAHESANESTGGGLTGKAANAAVDKATDRSAGNETTHNTQTPTHSSAGDRVASAAAGAASGSHIDSTTGTRSSSNNAVSTPTSSAAGDRTSTGMTGATGATGTTGATTGSSTRTGAGGAVERGMEHLREHAAPPPHKHHQPGRDTVLGEAEAKMATHDHQHLAPVTHETRHHHEVEEVERQREIDRHVHHVQHHVQPVVDEQHAGEVHHEKAVPVTKIHERHVATDEDKTQFASLNKAKDSVVEAPRERTIIDRGEQVHENVQHHVHHIVQPTIERDTHEHHKIHTTIPIHETVHEAPVVHQSTVHEPLPLKEFVAGGGDLKSTLRHDADALLDRGECERTVDGPAETLTQQLGLASIGEKKGTASITNPIGERGTTAATGTGGAATSSTGAGIGHHNAGTATSTGAGI